MGWGVGVGGGGCRLVKLGYEEIVSGKSFVWRLIVLEMYFVSRLDEIRRSFVQV